MNKELTTQQQNNLQSYAANLQSSLAFAKMLITTNMVPAHFKTAEGVVAACLYGQELGFSPMQSLQSVNVISGKPTLSAEALKALILQSGGRIETITWTSVTCKLRGIRGDWKEEVEFSMMDATKMGLASKDNWRKMPQFMLYARCVSALARNMWADITKGFYSTEEITDHQKPQNIQVVKTGNLKRIEEKPAIDITDSGQTINVETGEIISEAGVLDSVDVIAEEHKEEQRKFDEPDWSSYKYKYHLPYKKTGKDMQAVRDYVKNLGWKWRPAKDKDKSDIPGGDDCWYTNDEAPKLAEYLRENTDYKWPEKEEDDLPENWGVAK